MLQINEYIIFVAKGIEILGVSIMVIGLAFAHYNFLSALRGSGAYMRLRQQVGKAILLGLEVLVAADIIMTVTTEPTVENVLVLGLVVLIRTFLSFSLEVELEGRWPWQSKNREGQGVNKD